MGQIDWELGRRLYIRGESMGAIAGKLSCNKSSVCRRAKAGQWERADVALRGVAGGAVKLRSGGAELGEAGDVSGSGIKLRLQADVSAAVGALEQLPPADLALHQLAMRERVAADVTKRASTLFDIGGQDQALVNIAVLSQLPDVVEG